MSEWDKFKKRLLQIDYPYAIPRIMPPRVPIVLHYWGVPDTGHDVIQGEIVEDTKEIES